MGDKESDAFAREYGDDAYQALFESFYEERDGGPVTDGRFTITDIVQQNACNYDFSAIFQAGNGDEVSILARDGDWDGSMIESWSKTDLLVREPHQPTIYSFKPRDWLPKGLFEVYLAWRKEPWFKDMERAYNYDRFFAPGGKTETHYREKAAKRGLMIATTDECEAYVARGPMTEEDRRVIDDAVAMMGQA